MATPAAALVVETPTLPTEVTASNMSSTGMMIGGPKPEPRAKIQCAVSDRKPL